MEDPQVIIEKLKIAQTYTNSALTPLCYDVGTLGAALDSQTKACVRRWRLGNRPADYLDSMIIISQTSHDVSLRGCQWELE